MPDNQTPVRKDLDAGTEKVLASVKSKLDNVQFTPVEGQIAFIKELIKSPAETRAFIAAPKDYAVDHGILLNPDVVRAVVNQVMFDASLDTALHTEIGPSASKDLIDLRDRLKPGGLKPVGPGGDPVNPAANAAAVAAGAAVAMAVVAVVTMVVTLVRAKKPEDLVSLQGLGAHGVLLPGKQIFVNRGKALGGIAAVRGLGTGIR